MLKLKFPAKMIAGKFMHENDRRAPLPVSSDVQPLYSVIRGGQTPCSARSAEGVSLPDCYRLRARKYHSEPPSVPKRRPKTSRELCERLACADRADGADDPHIGDRRRGRGVNTRMR